LDEVLDWRERWPGCCGASDGETTDTDEGGKGLEGMNGAADDLNSNALEGEEGEGGDDIVGGVGDGFVEGVGRRCAAIGGTQGCPLTVFADQ
jgi:hypothetical protein